MQVDDALYQHAGLAAAGACSYQERRPVMVRHCF
jgi:hypothetical protein